MDKATTEFDFSKLNVTYEDIQNINLQNLNLDIKLRKVFVPFNGNCKFENYILSSDRVFFLFKLYFLLKLIIGYLYHIKDEFFDVVNDKNLISNHEHEKKQPTYFTSIRKI